MKKTICGRIAAFIAMGVLLASLGGCASDKTVKKTFAERLYSDRIEKTDGAAIASSELVLLLDLPTYLGCSAEYDGNNKCINLKFLKRPKTDSETQKYAAVLLALIADAGKITWSYPYGESNSGMEMSASFTTKNAEYLLKISDVKECGKSPKAVQKMLDTLGIAR